VLKTCGKLKTLLRSGNSDSFACEVKALRAVGGNRIHTLTKEVRAKIDKSIAKDIDLHHV
jgi:hypothetical protein